MPPVGWHRSQYPLRHTPKTPLSGAHCSPSPTGSPLKSVHPGPTGGRVVPVAPQSTMQTLAG